MTNTHNDNISLLNLLDPTVRSLLVDLAFAEVLDWASNAAGELDHFGNECDALFAMTDLSRSQFSIVAEAAYQIAQER